MLPTGKPPDACRDGFRLSKFSWKKREDLTDVETRWEYFPTLAHGPEISNFPGFALPQGKEIHEINEIGLRTVGAELVSHSDPSRRFDPLLTARLLATLSVEVTCGTHPDWHNPARWHR